MRTWTSRRAGRLTRMLQGREGKIALALLTRKAWLLMDNQVYLLPFADAAHFVKVHELEQEEQREVEIAHYQFPKTP